MNSSVNSGFSCVVFPFQFNPSVLANESFNAPVKKQNGKEDCIWEADKLRAYHLKENVSSMLGLGKLYGNIGQIYTLRDSMRREMNIPDARTPLRFSCRGKEQELTCKLPHVRLTVFDTGIGFLEFTFSDLSENPEDVVDFNYFLCETKSGDNQLHYTKNLSKDEQEDISLSLLDMVQSLTAMLGDINDFDTQLGLRYIDNKPLMFSYLLLNHMPDDFGRLMFNLRTNFKASYQVPQEQYNLQDSAGVFHPFDNVWWGTSLNATICCAFLTDNEKTNDFFRATFPSNVRETYLQLFLLRQHQRYCMQKMQKKYAVAGAELLSVHGENIPAAYKKITALRERAIAFKLRCMFSDPTTVEHINEYDDFLQKNLHIPQTMQDFAASVEQLTQAATNLKEKIDKHEQKEREKKQEKRDKMIFGFTALWTTLVGFDSAWDIAERLTKQEIWFDSLWIILPIVLALLPISIGIHDIIKSKKEKD